MQRFLQKTTEFFDIPLDLSSRLLVLFGAVLMVPIFILPLWEIEFSSERYPSGLRLVIYSSTLEGGSESDLLEINVLNHYLGMKSIDEENVPQFRWMPFLLGFGLLVALRVVVLGKMSKLVDLFFLVAYLGLFSLWSFWSTLRLYGHDLNPFATVQIKPFSPPLIGEIEVANVMITSNPLAGAYVFVVVPLVFAMAMWLSRKSWIHDHLPSNDYIGTVQSGQKNT